MREQTLARQTHISEVAVSYAGVLQLHDASLFAGVVDVTFKNSSMVTRIIGHYTNAG